MIKILSKNVADKIAAGEVVERPLSIVKELVENSIDAGATSITIEIKNGGKTYIRVTDNGCGIPKEEAELAFMRHATSKITSDKDLFSIQTLGFRGEALSSIASVSRTELLTKQADNKTGVKLSIEGGITLENMEFGCPDGTTIVITDLFYNTPARLKFMKSDATESSLIIDFVSQVALAYPAIKTRIISNGNNLFTTQGKGDVYHNIITVYSKEVGEALVPVSKETEYVKVTGYVSSPKLSKTSRRTQIFFVNGRVINSKVIDRGVASAYGDKLFEGRFPVAFLFVHVPPDKLDVNIHPNKRQVRFDDEQLVSRAVTEAIREALLSKEAIPEVKTKDIQRKENNSPHKNTPTDIFKIKGTNEIKSCKDLTCVKKVEIREDQVNIKSILSNLRSSEIKEDQGEETQNFPKISSMAINESAVKYNAVPIKANVPFEFDQITTTGSIFGTYITAVDDDCFYMIDQHAAHERVFFEKLLRQYRDEEKVQQPIILPIVVNVSYAVSENAVDWLDTLEAMGFQVEAFGPKSYIVKAIPMFMELKEAEDFINYYIDNISENMDFDNQARIEKIMSMACKSAVKAHDLLSKEEIDSLILELSKCENPYSCPHGRPTFIKMTKYEIEKLFKRV